MKHLYLQNADFCFTFNPMTKKSEIGKLGEDIACQYLLNKSFTIIERNFRKKWGELDIIAKDSNGVLVFVEVKTMRQSGNAELKRQYEESIGKNPAIMRLVRHRINKYDKAQLNPEENLTAAKLGKLKRTAQLYAGSNPDLINENKGWRIDLIAITLFENGEPEIKHFENIG